MEMMFLVVLEASYLVILVAELLLFQLRECGNVYKVIVEENSKEEDSARGIDDGDSYRLNRV